MNCLLFAFLNFYVKVEYPLKQGLKPKTWVILFRFFLAVKVEYPLK